MKICILIATWQRIEVTETCYINLQRLIKQTPQHEFTVMIIASEPEHITLAKKYKFKHCEHENFPVGKKLNYGLEQCLKFEWDYLTQIGSDDVVIPDAFKFYDAFIGKEDFFGINNSLWIDRKNKRAKYFLNEDVEFAHGAFRFISRAAVEKASIKRQVILRYQMVGFGFRRDAGIPMYLPQNEAHSLVRNNKAAFVEGDEIIELWPPNANRALDSGSQRSLNLVGYYAKIVPVEYPVLFDLKSETNINPFDVLEGRGEWVDYDEAMKNIKSN